MYKGKTDYCGSYDSRSDREFTFKDWTFRSRELTDENIFCLGAAQTIGRYENEPFSEILGNKISTNVMNLGKSGAGYEFFLQDDIINLINTKGKLCVLQILSGRSISTSYFDLYDKNNLDNEIIKYNAGLFFTEKAKSIGLVEFDKQNEDMIKLIKYKKSIEDLPSNHSELVFPVFVKNESLENKRKLFDEMLTNYIIKFDELRDKIKIPIILLYLGKEDYVGKKNIKESNYEEFGYSWPTIIGQTEVEYMKSKCEYFVSHLMESPGYCPDKQEHIEISLKLEKILTELGV